MKNSSKTFTALASLMLISIPWSFPAAKADSLELPAIVSSVPPTISSIAIAVHASGKVVVELSLDSEGKVVAQRVIEGHPLFRKATEEAASQWRFAVADERSRVVQLTFIYSTRNYGEPFALSILPYGINLIPKLPEPPDTVSYIPSDWHAGDICKVHGEVLQKDKVEIVYGLIGFRKGYLDAEKKSFPNANTKVYGGCLVEFEKYAEVLYCRRCRMAEQRWGQKNRHRKPSF